MNLNSHIQNLPGSKILPLQTLIGMIFLNVHHSTKCCIIHFQKIHIFLWYVIYKEQSPLPSGKLLWFKKQLLGLLRSLKRRQSQLSYKKSFIFMKRDDIRNFIISQCCSAPVSPLQFRNHDFCFKLTTTVQATEMLLLLRGTLYRVFSLCWKK